MTREEEIVRSTMAALASTVTQVRPLRLTEAADEANGSAPALSGANRIRPAARVRPDTSVRPDARSQPRPARRWRAWGAPVAAAALVVALAVALVIVRNMPSRGRATPVAPQASCGLPSASRATPAGAAPSVDGVPPYYVEVVACSGSTSRSGLLVGGTLTGKVVATVAPPAGLSFLSVSAAADDRTFAIFATPIGAGPKVAGWWYLLRLAPGTSSPARLTRIPVKPLPDVAETAISGSGRELAVGVANDGASRPWIGVYSVATGRLLRSWSYRSGPSVDIEGWSVSSFTGTVGNPQNSALTWAQGDQAIMFWTVAPGGVGALRRLDIAGDGSDIVRDSRVIWSAAHRECDGFNEVSADGKTVICADVSSQGGGKANGTLRWLAYSITAPAAAPSVRYQVPDDNGVVVSTPWVSASGATMLVAWSTNQQPQGALKIVNFGLVSRGTFTPLKPPPLSNGYVGGRPLIAW
jgi:hypothetical protein